MKTLSKGDTVTHSELGKVTIEEVVTFSEEFDVYSPNGDLELASTTPDREKVKIELPEGGIIARDLETFLDNIEVQ